MAAVSKEEYLKRYLSNADSGKKRKRIRKVKTGIKAGKSLIIDDDVNLSDIRIEQDLEDAESLLETADENPLIFNEKGTTVLSKDLTSIKRKEEEKKAMWAPVNSFQESLSVKKNTSGFSPKKGLYDSISPERGNVNKEIILSNQPGQSQVISIKGHRKQHDSSSDQSSPRSLMKLPAQHDSADFSSQRQRGNFRSKLNDLSPPKKTEYDSSSDQSPPRNRQSSGRENFKNTKFPVDQSPSRQGRHDSSSDQSPPRTKQAQERKTRMARHDSPDLSPPRRKGNAKMASYDQSQGTQNRHDSSSDQSPPRRARPPTKQTSRSPLPDRSPLGSRAGKRSFKGDRSDKDLSETSLVRNQKSSERKAGLHSGAELKYENEQAKLRETEMFSRMGVTKTGKDAQTVHRDKTGRKRDFKVEEIKKKEDERKKQEENKKFMEWGKGVQQSKSAKEKVDDEIYEMSKPLARYKNDEDLDRMLRDRERAEDPMLAFMQKKKSKQDVMAGKREKPKYKGPAPPPNRFNIPPGYRWDGVDRSNGFEKKRFAMLANKGATRDEAYKWSVENM